MKRHGGGADRVTCKCLQPRVISHGSNRLFAEQVPNSSFAARQSGFAEFRKERFRFILPQNCRDHCKSEIFYFTAHSSKNSFAAKSQELVSNSLKRLLNVLH